MLSEPIRIRPGEDGQLIVQLPYSPDHVAKIKTVPGRHGMPKNSIGRFPKEMGRWAAC